MSDPWVHREGERPPPASSHPLAEGEKRQDWGDRGTITHPDVPREEGVVGDRGREEPLHIKLYNNRLQPWANALRKDMTKAEACLWKYVLRAGQMKGYTFNRQRPVLRYIADFMCKPLRLIIEVDGSSHDDPKVQKHDAFRQRELEESGFTVIRFTNDEVLKAIGSVKRRIELKIDEIESRQDQFMKEGDEAISSSP